MNREEIEKELLYIRNLNQMSFDCIHKPWPKLNKIPMVCNCFTNYLEKKYADIIDETLKLCEEKLESKETKYIIAWIQDISGWKYEEYTVRDYPSSKKGFIGIALVRTDKYSKEEEDE